MLQLTYRLMHCLHFQCMNTTYTDIVCVEETSQCAVSHFYLLFASELDYYFVCSWHPGDNSDRHWTDSHGADHSSIDWSALVSARQCWQLVARSTSLDRTNLSVLSLSLALEDYRLGLPSWKRFVHLFFFFFFFFLRSPAISLGFTTFGWDFCVCDHFLIQPLR